MFLVPLVFITSNFFQPFTNVILLSVHDSSLVPYESSLDMHILFDNPQFGAASPWFLSYWSFATVPDVSFTELKAEGILGI